MAPPYSSQLYLSITLKKNLNNAETYKEEKDMKESIMIAGEVYFLGFAIAMLIAALIKGMLAVIGRLSAQKQVTKN